MYQLFSQISQWLGQPFFDAAQSTNVAFLSVLFLGFVGSIAPCQLTGNIGAITYFSNRYMQLKFSRVEFMLFFMGKILVFSVFGFLFWGFGNTISTESIPIFVITRKLVGPTFILMGLVLLKLIRFPKFFYRLSFHPLIKNVTGNKGAFLMGILLSLGFCPTMFTLFFGGVMPIAIQSSYGFILPSIFALGTTLPLLLIVGLSSCFDLDRSILRIARKTSNWIQTLGGMIFILLGISDTITYWSI
ncbi:sulfite exporter TauE/SafE family protein [Laceyella putida]|uniref:Sulfite exporter TauE/SafE family protein n=1 Tax=Laceyella putida TaxID=110101 RepID=A0ABW2RL71_9BACL